MHRRLIGRLAGLFAATGRAPHALAAQHLPADTPLAALALTAFDTETTGLNVRRDRILSVGALALQGDQRETEAPVDLLVHPGMKIPGAATAIHGIDDSRVAAAPPLALVWPTIQACWYRRALLGHNIAFDLAVLLHEAERHRLPFHPPPALLDIGLLYAGLRPRQAQITLERIAADLCVPIARRHDALADAETAAAIWQRLLPALQQHGIGTLAAARALMLRQRDLLYGQGRAGWAVELL